MTRGKRTCPVCRKELPPEMPGICLRLKAAVEAVAGPQVAARRAELAAIPAPPPPPASQPQQPVTQPWAQRASLLAAQEAQRQRDSEEQDARISQRQAAVERLPPGVPAAASRAASWPAQVSAEESRWRCMQLAATGGWVPGAAGSSSSAASGSGVWQQEQQEQQQERQQRQRWRLQEQEQRRQWCEEAQQVSVMQSYELVQRLPPGAPALAGRGGEVCAEESRWGYMQVMHVGSGAGSGAVAGSGTGIGAGGSRAAGGSAGGSSRSGGNTSSPAPPTGRATLTAPLQLTFPSPSPGSADQPPLPAFTLGWGGDSVSLHARRGRPRSSAQRRAALRK